MLQVESDATKVSFSDSIVKQDDSESDEHFSTEDDEVSRVATETLIVFPTAPGAK